MIDRRELAVVIARLQDFVAADGAAIELLDVAPDGTVSLQLRLDAVECVDCVVPAPMLAEMVGQFVRRHLAEVTNTRLVDPRTEDRRA